MMSKSRLTLQLIRKLEERKGGRRHGIWRNIVSLEVLSDASHRRTSFALLDGKAEWAFSYCDQESEAEGMLNMVLSITLILATQKGYSHKVITICEYTELQTPVRLIRRNAYLEAPCALTVVLMTAKRGNMLEMVLRVEKSMTPNAILNIQKVDVL